MWKLSDNVFEKAFKERVIQIAESMFNSKPVEEICYALNSNLFEKTKNICAMTRRENWKKETWGKILLEKRDISGKPGRKVKTLKESTLKLKSTQNV